VSNSLRREKEKGMSDGLPVDALVLCEEVKAKYQNVALNPHGIFHFHTRRPLARRLGYDERVVARMPDSAIEAFARSISSVISTPTT